VKEDFARFQILRNELSVARDGKILLRENRIVIPCSLRLHTLKLAHIGHQGVVKTKALLREKVWFPRIDAAVASLIKDCLACQSTNQYEQRSPLCMS
jgi:hypothetical protein